MNHALHEKEGIINMWVSIDHVAIDYSNLRFLNYNIISLFEQSRLAVSNRNVSKDTLPVGNPLYKFYQYFLIEISFVL